MAIIQVSVKTTEVETQRLGYTGISLTNMLNSTEPLVSSGSVIEIGGSLYEFNSNTDIDPAGGLSGISNGNMVWMYINASTLSSVVTTTEPIWSEEKQAWYDSTETHRYYGCMFKNSSGNYTNKQIIEGRIWKPEIFITDNYTISDEFINMKIILDGSVSANKTITLPTLADNLGKKIKIDNRNSTYDLIIDGEGVETINGFTTSELEEEWMIIEGVSGDWKVIERSNDFHNIPTADRNASWDLAVGTATSPTDINFSSYIKQGRKATKVLIKAQQALSSGNISGTILFRKNGESSTNTVQAIRFYSYGDGFSSNTQFARQFEVACDDDGIIEYWLTSATNHSVNVAIEGYWYK